MGCMSLCDGSQSGRETLQSSGLNQDSLTVKLEGSQVTRAPAWSAPLPSLRPHPREFETGLNGEVVSTTWELRYCDFREHGSQTRRCKEVISTSKATRSFVSVGGDRMIIYEFQPKPTHCLEESSAWGVSGVVKLTADDVGIETNNGSRQLLQTLL
eukprot:865089-Amphidinium_carterae.1